MQFAFFINLTIAILFALPGVTIGEQRSVNSARASSPAFEPAPILQPCMFKPGYQQIYTVEDLDQIRNNLSGKFQLRADLSLMGAFQPFGIQDPNVPPVTLAEFTGIFEGCGHTISGLSIIDEPIINELPYGTGLFRSIGATGVVKDVTLTNVVISGSNAVGAFAGINRGKLINVRVGAEDLSLPFSELNRIVGDSFVGGLVGINLGGEITNSKFRGDVNGSYGIGGIAGYTEDTTTPTLVKNCSADVQIVGSAVSVGGIVGVLNQGGRVLNSHSTGFIYAEIQGGGLIGHSEGGRIEKSSSSVLVLGVDSLGGLVGLAVGGSTSQSSATGSVMSTGDYIGGAAGRIYQHDIDQVFTSNDVQSAGYLTKSIGGLVGDAEDSSITDSYVSCSQILALSGEPLSLMAGGLIGRAYSTEISRSYVNADFHEYSVALEDIVVLSPFFNPADTFNAITDSYFNRHNGQDWPSNYGAIGLTTAQMTVPGTLGAYEGWDFNQVWSHTPGEFPTLRFAGEIDNSCGASDTVTCQQGNWVVSGGQGTILTANRNQPAPTEWVAQDSAIGNSTKIFAIDFRGNNSSPGSEFNYPWIAAAEGGHVTRSLNYDASSWSDTVITSVNIFDVAHSRSYDLNESWIAGGGQGKLLKSINGSSWQLLYSGFGSSQIQSVTFKESVGEDPQIWLITGENGKIAKSLDHGDSWSMLPSSPFGNSTIFDAAHSGGSPGRWVLVGANGKMYSSPDLAVWSSATYSVPGSTFGTSSIRTVSYSDTGLSGGSPLWVAAGANGKLFRSTDGSSWTQVSGGWNSNTTFFSVEHNKLSGSAARWYAVGSDGIVVRSDDGIAWVMDHIADNPVELRDVKFRPGKCEAIGSSLPQ